jgi:hypothetical protein
MGFWRKAFPRQAVTGAQGMTERDPKVQKAIEAGLQREFGEG